MLNSKLFSIEQLINVNSIKYDHMSEMVAEAYAGSDATELNVFLDLYSILKPLYKQDLYSIDNYSLVTSCLVNMVAHYREFFRSRYGVETKFYLIHSENAPYINNQFVSGYNKSHAMEFVAKGKISDMIKFNTEELLKVLTPYLPDIFYIKTTFEVGVVIQDIIFRKEANGEGLIPNLIITKDIYNYQLAARPGVTIFRPKKRNGIDESYYINRDNLMNVYIKDRKNDKITTFLSPDLLSTIMALTKMPERNMKSMFFLSTVIRTFETAINEQKIFNSRTEGLEYLVEVLNSVGNGKRKIVPIEFINRFKAIDILYQQKLFMSSPESKYEFVNLYDPDGVKFINNKYFPSNPLDLNRL